MRRKSSVQQECACTPLITSEKFLSNTASSTPLGHWPGGGLTAADTQRSCPEVGVFVPAGEGGAHEAVTSEDGGAGGAHSCIFVGEQAGGGSCSSARVRLKTARRSRCTPQWRTRNSPEKEGPNDYHEPRADASRQVEGASCISTYTGHILVPGLGEVSGVHATGRRHVAIMKICRVEPCWHGRIGYTNGRVHGKVLAACVHLL